MGFRPEAAPESSYKGEATFMSFVWKEFFTSTKFEVHQKIHTGVREYMCFECEKDFYYSELFTFTFNHLADAYIQSDVQMRRTIEAIRPSREQQYTSALTSLS